MRDEGGSAGAIVVAFILGAVVGAAAAMLTAPAAGDETRRVLGERTRDSREKAAQAVRQGREFLNRQRGVLSTAIERGRQAYDQARGAVEPTPESEGGAQ
jgi:gas vesicle protein